LSCFYSSFGGFLVLLHRSLRALEYIASAWESVKRRSLSDFDKFKEKKIAL